MEGGMFSAWAGVLQDMLSPLGLSDTDIGIMGFNISLFSMVGGMVTGPVADKFFVKKLRRFIYILFGLTVIVLFMLLFVLPSPWSNDSMILLHVDSSQLTKNVVLNIFIGLLGFCEGGLVPLFYELSVEVSYPVSEGSVLCCWCLLQCYMFGICGNRKLVEYKMGDILCDYCVFNVCIVYIHNKGAI